jgi:hypothetical protein
MKLRFTHYLLTALLLAFAKPISASTEITPSDAAQTLTQGEDYTFPSAAGYYVNPSFFSLNEDGTYRFRAITGSYQVTASDDLNYLQVRALNEDDDLATLQADGSGALWIIGNNIGLPSVKANVIGWNTSKAICMAQVRPAVYEITLIGQTELTGDDFKFFGQAGWGTEFHGTNDNGYLLTSTSDIFMVKDNGNLKLKDGVVIDKGNQYVITVDLTAGLDAGVLSTTMEERNVEFEPKFNGHIMQIDADGNYVYEGGLTTGETCSFSGVEEFNDPELYVDPDFFAKNDDGNYSFVPINGTYAVVANFNLNYIKVYATADGQPATYDVATGQGQVWTIGSKGIGKPSYKTNSQNWWNNIRYCNALAQIAPQKYQLTLTVGKELDANNVSFKFFGQAGWGTEFNQNPSIAIEDNEHFTLSEKGNVILKDGQTLTDGDTYRFVLDCTDPANALLTVNDVTTGIRLTTENDKETDTPYYNLQGMRVIPSQPGLYIHNGKKIIIR